jgi:phage terminase large subunit GpA-like protein
VPNDLAVQDSGSPVLFVVASVDVQKKNLFVDVKGYSIGCVTWTIDFFPIEGETEQFNGPWDELDKYISDTRFIGTDGKIYRTQITIVDSGHYTEYVYAYVKRHSFGVYACKGQNLLRNGETYALFSPTALQHIGMTQAFHVNTGKLKDKISVLLTQSFWISGQHQPWWYPNFPEDFRDDYFQMFEAETKKEYVDKKTNKVIGTFWQQSFGKPNHALDTYVYNLAGLEIAAEYYCRDMLGLPALDYNAFWEVAKTGEFYEEPHKK